MKRPNLKKKIRQSDFDTQRAFAFRIGIDHRKISEFISGVRNPSGDEFVSLAKGLECEVPDVENDFEQQST